ncbi:MAG: hypothetical protein KKI08_21275, partial [Armatimonadetes bacterium]|nr:hypothetical protein [Armatimonadota bacterium]
GACARCEPVAVAPPPMRGSYARVAVAADGRIMVVWSPDDGTYHIRWSCFDGVAWSAHAAVTAGSGPQGYPWIVADAQGRFHLVHDDGLGDGRRVHYNRYDGADCSGGWHDPAEEVPRTHDYSTPYPSVGVDEQGRPHVTYSQSVAPKPEPWEACGPNGECPPAYHCYPSGTPICVPDYEQHFAIRLDGEWGAGTWSAPVAIASSAVGPFAHHGAVFVLDSTSVHAVWLQDLVPGDHQIYYAQFDGSSWTWPEPTGIGDHAADVQAHGDRVFVFSNSAQATSRAIAGGPWAPAEGIATGPTTINLTKLRVGADGRLHAVYNQGYRVMYATTDAQGAWLPPKPVSPAVVPGALYANEPSLDVDAGGVAHLVWSQSDCGFEEGGAACELGSVWYLAARFEELP